MTKIRVGGVPEHFNLPWHLCLEEGDFKYEHLEVEWRDFPDGTGAMNKALREGEIDVAVILTEGIIKDIAAGNPSKIIQTFIASPLIWGIHVDYHSPFQKVNELQNTTAAISRNGSGSHLMAYVNADRKNWDLNTLEFRIVGDINGAIEALTADEAQYFMWERFTTKPLVDKKIFRRVGDCPTPWPCFVIAANTSFIQEHEAELGKMLEVVNSKSVSFKEIPKVENILASRYDQRIEDIKEWLEITSWSQSQLTIEELEDVQDRLKQLNLIEEKQPASNFIFNLASES